MPLGPSPRTKNDTGNLKYFGDLLNTALLRPRVGAFSRISEPAGMSGPMLRQAFSWLMPSMMAAHPHTTADIFVNRVGPLWVDISKTSLGLRLQNEAKRITLQAPIPSNLPPECREKYRQSAQWTDWLCFLTSAPECELDHRSVNRWISVCPKFLPTAENKHEYGGVRNFTSHRAAGSRKSRRLRR